MAQSPPVEETDEERLTPQDILDQYLGPDAVEEHARATGGGSTFRHLFTPKTRALVVDVLVGERGDALTAKEIVNHHEDLSVTGFNRHREPLLGLGVVVEAGKRGNAMTYALNTRHPVAQLLAMLDNVTMWGETPALLETQFLTDEDVPTAIDQWSRA